MKKILILLLVTLSGLWLYACADPDKPTVGLYLAIKRGDIDQIERHIFWKTDINQLNADGQTPLHESATVGRVVISQLLLKNGAEIDKVNRDGKTALYIALKYGRTQLADLLITRFNARFNATESLFDIVRDNVNDRDVIRFLVQKGADVNSFDNNGLTPLITAIQAQQRVIAKHLIANNADVNLPSGQGVLPLTLAEQLNNPDLIALLKDNGARDSQKP